MNDFIRELKMKHGLCVIILHHAGKNETQRGRTDIEDHLELVIKLSPMPEAYVGELRVQLEYEKKREKGIIHNFCFVVDANGGWQVLEDSRTLEITNLLLRGVSWSAIERKLRVSSKTIAKIKRMAEERGTKFPSADSQNKSDKREEKANKATQCRKSTQVQ